MGGLAWEELSGIHQVSLGRPGLAEASTETARTWEETENRDPAGLRQIPGLSWRGEGPALGECLAAPAPRVSDWARRSPPSVPLPPSRSPPSLARRQPRLAPCPLPGGTFRAAAAASFTLYQGTSGHGIRAGSP